MITVGGHTFNETLLTDGAIIDIGCRMFDLAKHFPDKQVYCFDMAEDIWTDIPPNAICHKVAISDKAGQSAYYANGEATCLQDIDPDKGHTFKPCTTITMDDLYKITGTNVDLLKLDCEGAEYIILGETFKPIPKQITVEFHNHCVPALHNANYQAIVERLSEHYTMHNAVWEARHGCGFNFWDTLFIKK
jgi:FkbM family methyltransferase